MFAFLAVAALAVNPALSRTRTQKAPTLQQYLKEHPWDPAKRGVMMVVSPERTHAVNDLGGLAAFGRREMSAGNLTVLAPDEMVLIDTQLKEEPDYYDGLPRDQKVLYLASLLDNNQWNIASTTGIGLGDLNRDEQAVFRSILPSVFTFQNSVLREDHSTADVPGQPSEITLTRDEEAGVRIQFYKEITLGVRMADNRGYSGIANQVWDVKKPGDPVLYRKNVADEDKTSLFGVQIRKTLPNKLKPSDLDYRSPSLNPPILLAPQTTVADLCKSVSTASGLNVVADIRIGRMTVQTAGDSARAGDVLQGLALGITGTFRRVGNMFELTCDLEGMGTKRLKLAFWSWDLREQTQRRAEVWKQAISANGGISKIKYQAGSPLLPNDAMVKFMQGDTDQGSQMMPASDLPSLWQDKLNHGGHFAPPGIRTDVAEPFEAVFWCFVLPDGRALNWENEVGQMNDFLPSAAVPRDTSSKSVVTPIAFDPNSTPALVYKTEDPAVAARLPELAKDHGFQEVWIRTWRPDCLSSAIAAGKTLNVHVRLILEPWDVKPNAKNRNADASMVDMSLSQATSLQGQTSWWNVSEPIWGISQLPATDTLGPNDGSLAGNWQLLLTLAAMPGLSGSVLLETEPPGYEPNVSQARSLPIEMTAILDLGYNMDLRTRFLAANSVDPVDFIDTRLSFKTLDLSTLAFGDPNLFGFGSLDSSQPQGSMVKWIQFLSDANLQATRDFASRVPGPVLFQARRTIQDIPRLGEYLIVPWQSSADLPTTSDQPLARNPPPIPTDDYWLWQFGWPLEVPVSSRLYDNLTKHLKNAGGKIAIDLSSVPPDQLEKVMVVWFKP